MGLLNLSVQQCNLIFFKLMMFEFFYLFSCHRTEITIYVEEQSTATGNVKRVPASELYAFVCQQRIQQKLQQNMAAESCVPRAAIKPEQIKQILENPPSGKLQDTNDLTQPSCVSTYVPSDQLTMS